MRSSFQYHLSKGGRFLQHYLSLIAICIAGVVGFYVFQHDPGFQKAIVVATAVSYVSWGVCHHYIHRDYSLLILFEYLILATFGVIIVFSLL